VCLSFIYILFHHLLTVYDINTLGQAAGVGTYVTALKVVDGVVCSTACLCDVFFWKIFEDAVAASLGITPQKIKELLEE